MFGFRNYSWFHSSLMALSVTLTFEWYILFPIFKKCLIKWYAWKENAWVLISVNWDEIWQFYLRYKSTHYSWLYHDKKDRIKSGLKNAGIPQQHLLFVFNDAWVADRVVMTLKVKCLIRVMFATKLLQDNSVRKCCSWRTLFLQSFKKNLIWLQNLHVFSFL